MAKVQSSRAKIYETNSSYQDEPPSYLESEGDRLIKDMVQKQLSTEVTLHGELLRQKSFSTSEEYQPITNLISGKRTLKEFESFTKRTKYTEELQSYGLSKDEIEIALDFQLGEEYFRDKYIKMEKSLLASQLLLIHTKIKNAQTDMENSAKERLAERVGRQKMEICLSEKPNSSVTKLLKFALSCQAPVIDKRPANHPINSLKEMEEELFGHLKKKRKKVAVYRPTPKQNIVPVENFCYHKTSKNVTLWDMNTNNGTVHIKNEQKANICNFKIKNIDSNVVTKPYLSQPKTLYTVKDGKIVLMKDLPKKNNSEGCKQTSSCSGSLFVVPTELPETSKLSLEHIMKHRLTLEEIKSLPKFKNYDPGKPSPVLYIKNLASCVQEMDLISIFCHFEEASKNKIIYRLMVGKMKGQAFVTFPNCLKASEAMETANGYMLKGKPMIIQYGKGDSKINEVQPG